MVNTRFGADFVRFRFVISMLFFHASEPDWKALGCDVNPDEAPVLIAQENADNDNSDDEDDEKRTGTTDQRWGRGLLEFDAFDLLF